MRHLLEGWSSPLLQGLQRQTLWPIYTAANATSPPLGSSAEWLFPTNEAESAEDGDVLHTPVTSEEVVQQFARTKKSAPGSDKITYADWRWVDPLGLILSDVFNICRVNSRVSSTWKHSSVTLIHKGGDNDPSNVRSWRPISLQLKI